MMSEAEIHILQGRMHEVVLNKARRGDLYVLPPVGYVKFDRLGSVRRVLRYLQANDIKMPVRPHKVPTKGTLDWRRATRDVVRTVLMHPLNSGTYRYGHRQTDQRRKEIGRPETGRVVVQPDQYDALIHDHCPAYITLAQYERNQEKIQNSRLSCSTKGPARDGHGLLGEIVFCALPATNGGSLCGLRKETSILLPDGEGRQRYPSLPKLVG